MCVVNDAALLCLSESRACVRCQQRPLMLLLGFFLHLWEQPTYTPRPRLAPVEVEFLSSGIDAFLTAPVRPSYYMQRA